MKRLAYDPVSCRWLNHKPEFERSRLCVKGRLPGHVRHRLRTPATPLDHLAPDGVVSTSFDRTIRVLFDTGLEVRIVPAKLLTITSLYHVHDRIVGSGHLRRRALMADISAPERVLFTARHSWDAIMTPGLSNHARLRAISTIGAAPDHELSIDAGESDRVILASAAFQVTISRPNRTGLGIGVGPFEPLASLSSEIKLRLLAQMTDQALARMPFLRRWRIKFPIAIDRAVDWTGSRLLASGRSGQNQYRRS